MKLPVTIKRFNRLVDRSVNIIINTNLELTSEQVGELDAKLNETGWLIIDDDQPVKMPEPKAGSKSQQLRLAIEHHRQKHAPNKNEEEYYQDTMKILIERFNG